LNTHKLFSDFDAKIRLNDSKVKKLKGNRKALRNKIRDHFKEKDWEKPSFYSQGSFPLKTNLNPILTTTSDGDIKEKYDLDDGVYFLCPESERKEPATYHDRIKKAVDGHAEKVVDKTTCVRVVYADGHHIDLPSYWLERDGDVPQLAHKSKGFIDSDPKAFKDWVDKEISTANSNGQLRRIIRYLKAWKNYRENKNSSIKLPSGFILTILACDHFVKNTRDDLSFKETVESIKSELDRSFTCYRPTVPTDEQLLSEYSKDTVLRELDTLLDNAQKALDSDCEKEASELWRKVFGDRFPLGKKSDEKPAKAAVAQPARTMVNSPWSLS
jgi:Cyclic GMP-AMP synthase DncV-like, nucleotidyltransferase domain